MVKYTYYKSKQNITQTSNDALRKIGIFGKCINLLNDKSTLISCVFCSNIRLSNDSRRFNVKLTLFNLVDDENASNSIELMEFRLSINISKCRKSWKRKKKLYFVRFCFKSVIHSCVCFDIPWNNHCQL